MEESRKSDEEVTRPATEYSSRARLWTAGLIGMIIGTTLGLLIIFLYFSEVSARMGLLIFVAAVVAILLLAKFILRRI